MGSKSSCAQFCTSNTVNLLSAERVLFVIQKLIIAFIPVFGYMQTSECFQVDPDLFSCGSQTGAEYSMWGLTLDIKLTV